MCDGPGVGGKGSADGPGRGGKLCAISIMDSLVVMVSIWVVRDSNFAVMFWRRLARAISCSDMVGSGEKTVMGERKGEADLDG